MPKTTKQASHDLAQAVFADPELQERFETMVRNAASHEPVPDDFRSHFIFDVRFEVRASSEEGARAEVYRQLSTARPEPVEPIRYTVGESKEFAAMDDHHDCRYRVGRYRA